MADANVPEGGPGMVLAGGSVALSAGLQDGELGEKSASPGPTGASLAHGDGRVVPERFDDADFVSESDPPWYVALGYGWQIFWKHSHIVHLYSHATVLFRALKSLLQRMPPPSLINFQNSRRNSQHDTMK